jgi:UDP-glucose 4-epimerase
MTSCLITGGAGFLGSHLAKALLERACRVRVLDNFSSATEDNLAPLASRIEVVPGDLNNLSLVRKAVRGVELVFHLAPPSGGRDRLEADRHFLDLGIMNVLIAARDSEVRRVVYASSLSVYGEGGPGLCSEGDPKKPISAYAFAKLTGELDCTTFSYQYGLETVCLRYANVFGPRQRISLPYAGGGSANPQGLAAGLAPFSPWGRASTARPDLRG